MVEALKTVEYFEGDLDDPQQGYDLKISIVIFSVFVDNNLQLSITVYKIEDAVKKYKCAMDTLHECMIIGCIMNKGEISVAGMNIYS